MNIRCSSLPLTMLCGQSSSEVGLRIGSPDQEAAEDGTDCHDLIASMIQGAPTDFELLSESARPLVFVAWKMWRELLSPFFPNPQCEVPLSWIDRKNDLTITGHPDVMCGPAALEAAECRLLDWKFGRASFDYSAQLDGYAFLALQKYADAERCYLSIGHVRDQSIDSRYVTRKEAGAWYIKLLERLSDTTYRPGRHCSFCQRRANCEGATSVLRHSLSLVQKQNLDRLPTEPEARAAALEEVLVASRIISRATDDAEELIRAEVIAAGGRLGNIRITSEDRRGIVMQKAWPILNEELADDLTSVLKIGVGDVKKLVGDRAPHRGKGKAIEAFFSRLDEADAIRINTIEKLEIVKQAPKEIPCETV